MHEAIPGHHYQNALESQAARSNIQKLFNHPGYAEGWAAYVEDIGLECQLYDDIYSELGKWEWDIIRSVRLVLDVGLNYYGWSDSKAMSFWKTHISDRDNIAKREIARMKRWPAQVITYKYGANKFLHWKSLAQERKEFSLKAFHKKIMDLGPMSFSLLEKQLSK